MQKEKQKILIVLFILIINTLFIGLLVKYEHQDVTLYYEDTHVSSKYANVIEINTIDDFVAFAESVSHWNNYKGSLVILNADLDFSGYENFPVVGLEEENENIVFGGHFDGNGHVITGIRFEGPNEAGIFANVGGVIKNLRVENCFFTGEICGAIAAELTEGSIINCYVDTKVSGETAGAIVGKNNSGIIENCVANSYVSGELEDGIETNCYQIGEHDTVALNNNLIYLSGKYQDSSFNQWNNKNHGILSETRSNLLKSLTTTISVFGQKVILKGYYSVNDKQWCFALPAGYDNKNLIIEATSTHGDVTVFNRSKGTNQTEFVLADSTYHVIFVTAENAESLYIVLDQNKTLDYVHLNKREEIPGRMFIFDSEGNVNYKTFCGFYGHGNSSWDAEKKSYNLKFDSYENLLEMGANDNFALLAGYRMNSLMSYAVSHELAKKIGFPFVPEYRFVNLYVAGEYVGVYCLIEKIEIDTNRLEISSVYDEMKNMCTQELEMYEHQLWNGDNTGERRHYYNIETNPKDITGGYLLEIDFFDYSDEESRFTTKYSRNKIVLKRAFYSSEAQVNYIADFWQDFEDALFSEDGYNAKGKRYTEYIDIESFAMQWLMYELSKEDSMQSSIYYYKESDISGDGLIHACYPWDMERSYISLDNPEVFGSVNKKSDYWASFYKHEDFRAELARVWQKKLVPAIESMVSEQPSGKNSAMKNISWYELSIQELSNLENSRWSETDMSEKCDLIKNILIEREKVLSEEFSQTLNNKNRGL